MNNDVAHKTFGENFLLGLHNTESKGVLFALLEETIARHYPRYNLLEKLEAISDFDSVAAYQAKLAKLKIEYNAKLVNELRRRLIGLNNLGNGDRTRNKEKTVRKLNLLINHYPTLEDIIYITVATYINRGYGNTEKFKKELAEHYAHNR